MYNFTAHTLNGLPVNYSQIPNFALDSVETDKRLTPAEKLIYARILRYATLVKKTAFKITASWLSDNLAIDRKTVSRGLKSLKEYGYLNDDGIILVVGSNIDTPIALINDAPTRPTVREPEHAITPSQYDDVEVAQNSINFLREMLGIRRKQPVNEVDQSVDMG